ncbi:glycoside hydrolase family 3 N-terminal domain-containing protein [Amphibiibacter pelophylacis]|uniref:Exo 1,3/1,4-beta-D-glucan glucohydrolase n=1 Tax=Amphibiibacter pelophylacis TaxID=1799477 RepID=A0ACC6NZA6_9BURK
MKKSTRNRAQALTLGLAGALALAACGAGLNSVVPALPQASALKDWPSSIASVIVPDAAQEAEISRIVAGMSLAQKVGQMTQADIRSITPEEVKTYYIGSVLNGGGAWPNNSKQASVADWLALADSYWQASMDTDMAVKIPVIWGTDAVHGHNNVYGATLFPHNIGLGAAHDPDLVERIGAAVARQVVATGIDWTFAPTLAVVRDDRWGRTYEGFSEDPEIVASYGGRYTTGLQGRFAASGRPTVVATAKHFMGDGGTDMGKDQGETKASVLDMINIHAPGYTTALAAGAQTVMASFSSWTYQGPAPDGTPLNFKNVKMHGNKYLLTDVLKNKMGFDGLVVSDWDGIGQVKYTDASGVEKQCSNASCPAAINAGIDLIMVPNDWKAFIANTIASVQAGEIPQARIDDAVSRILRVKMRSGLMKVQGGQTVSTKPSQRSGAGDASALQARDLAREAVRKSLVLLKNKGGVLPLARGQKILVVGKNADSLANQNGGWSLSWQGTGNTNADFPNADSVLAGIREAAGESNVVYSATGKNVNISDFKAVIAVIGETPYAEGVGDIGKAGTLAHAQRYPEDLAALDAVSGKGVPVITVLESGRPVWVNREINRSDAFVAAWLPGTEGKGVADVLFRKADGSVNFDFSGRLSFSWPKTACQEPLNRGDASYDPLFAYGYGLNYTSSSTDVAALDETVPTLGCGQSAATGPAATDDLVVFRQAETALYPLFIGTPANWAMPVGSDLNAVVKSSDGNVTVQTSQLNVQQDAKKVTWTSTGQFMAQSVGVKTDYNGYLSANAALVFDVAVHQAPQGNVKMRVDCGYPCIGEVDTTRALRSLPLDTKSTVKIPLSCFMAKGTDFSAVDVPFLVFTEKPFSATFANIRWQIGAANDADAQTCDSLVPPPAATVDPLPGPSATLFGPDGSTLGGFALATWSSNNSHVVADTATTPGVMDLNFLADGANGTATLSGGPVNLASYAASGLLTLDVKVLSWGSNTKGLALKMESPGTDCRNIDYGVPQSAIPADGQFHSLSLKIADIAAQKAADCFSLENISVPFGIFPVWDDQQGVHIQVRNVRISTQ